MKGGPIEGRHRSQDARYVQNGPVPFSGHNKREEHPPSLDVAGCPGQAEIKAKPKSGCPVLAGFWLGWGKFQERILCRPRGTRLLFLLHPPLKRWAITFRARGA